ncbi:sugar ABC transporter substrate-binding protein [Galbitalea sp. SE-J8]|uniref:ABC transporter substrate-binding protein n=1 Tax=Galbitalea sp. SE-J8 TaxID=3054952 RepID=UPI00259D225E|nr:sugar ABC transporter substrate-binding protein [Galbitalea sp. SE-J8]MDM4762001.1 sugar ABC transporter substrate-binding protein [Galbitalea sp. SE-J8]
MYTAHRSTRAPKALATVASLAAAGLLLAGCSPSTTTPGGGTDATATADGTDDGTSLTMWTRAATQTQSKAFVDAYNASHKNQIELTIIPTDDYQAKVGSAAGANSLPDLFASDVAYLPNYTSQGLFQDITSRIDALPFADDLAQSHIKAGTWEGKEYAVPHTIDVSVLFYNKDLYTQAGLDPDKPPTTLEEFGEQARAVNKLGGDVSGTYFGGNCGGCLAFTWWPSIWAAGGQVLNEDGTASLLNSDDAKAVYAFYRSLYDDGITGAGTKDETGATWVAPFPDGKVGVMPMPSTMLGDMPASTGVAPIPGLGGGESTYVGGDAIGISASSKHADQAWNFLAWSLGDEAQVEVLAKNNDVVARTDLASNKYSEKDPRLVTINEVAAKGVAPLAVNMGAAVNDPNGPWTVLFRDAVFGDASKIDADNDAITAILAG